MPDARAEDWFAETPDETSYSLTMFSDRGASIQEVDLTRDEFITLKSYLGSMRGFGYAAQLAQILEENSDRQQAAYFIDDGREYIEKYPALVFAPVYPPELQPYLNPEVSGA